MGVFLNVCFKQRDRDSETKGESERKCVRENWTLQRLHTYG